MRITAIILASGFGKRFEGNKLLAIYKEKPLIMHIVEKVIRQEFHEVIIVSQYDEILDLVNASKHAKSNIKVIKNNTPHKGISESIKLGIQEGDCCEAYMFFVGDMPLIKAETIEKMLVAFKAFYLNEKSILCSSYKGQRGNPVIFSAAYKQELLSLEGDVGGRQVIKKHLSQVATYEVQCEEELFDIDTQSAYNKLLQGQFSFKKCE